MQTFNYGFQVSWGGGFGGWGRKVESGSQAAEDSHDKEEVN